MSVKDESRAKPADRKDGGLRYPVFNCIRLR
jgi:hypothetical protein